MFVATFKDAWRVQENLWYSVSDRVATNYVPAILYNKYKIWDMLVTTWFIRYASGYSLIMVSRSSRQPCVKLLYHDKNSVSM